MLSSIWEYPYEDHKRFKAKLDGRRKELREGSDEAANMEQQAMLARIQRIGIIEFINALQEDPNIDAGDFVRIPREALNDQKQQLRNELEQASQDEKNAHDNRMSVLGALENMRYIQKTWNQMANEMATDEDRSNNETEQIDGECIQGTT